MANNKIQLGFFFDQTRCMSCNACTVACKDWNQLNPGLVNWRKQFTYETEKGFFPLAMGCNHCEKPACMTACSYNAITKSDDGIVSVDRTKCKELKACITACPFAKPMIADDKQEPKSILGWQVKHPMQKCTMCKDRLEKGEKPACVMSCVGRALDFGNLADLKSKYTDAVMLSKAEFPYAYENAMAPDTIPSILIRRKKGTADGGIKIHKSDVYKA